MTRSVASFPPRITTAQGIRTGPLLTAETTRPVRSAAHAASRSSIAAITDARGGSLFLVATSRRTGRADRCLCARRWLPSGARRAVSSLGPRLGAALMTTGAGRLGRKRRRPQTLLHVNVIEMPGSEYGRPTPTR